MVTLLSKEHRIIDKPMMEFQPFGKEPDGRTISDLSGVVVRAHVELLEKVVSRKQGFEAGQRAVEELVQRLNERIPDPSYHVTAERLKNPWNGYSNEFAAFSGEFCIAISGEPRFFFDMGRQAISPIIQVLGRPFSVPQIYKMSAYFSQRYAKDSFLVEAVIVSERSAVLRMTFNERMRQQFGPYLRRCAFLWCEAVRGYFVGVPEQFHNLPAATVKNLLCIAEDDDRCEWEVTWSSGEGGGILRRGILSLARRILRSDIEQKERVMAEQVKTLDARHVELQETYVQQQQLTADLQRRVDQLTALHESGLLFASILDRETLIEKVLETVTEKLHYDRGMVSFFDADRKVLYDARIRGVSSAISDFARALHIPVTDPDSLEGQVLLKGESVLVRDIQSVWDRVHPLNQDLARKTNAKSIISVPLKVKNQVLGSLTVDRSRQEAIAHEDLDLLGTLATQVATALDNTRAYRQIEELLTGLEMKVRDRTAELAQANEQLKELDRLKGEFFANISHELRTPLTLSLSSYKALLKSPAAKDCEDLIMSGMRNTGRLLYLINELLELARFDSGRTELKKRPIDLSTLMRDITANFLPSSKRRIHLIGVQEAVVIEADSDRMNKVMYNLLSNAFKFSDPDKGEIWIRVDKGSDTVAVEVEDNGIGIPRTQLDRIFERFTQVEGSTTRTYEGSGIGLALVKEIVKLHAGTIKVDSEVGQGSTFTITLPIGNVSGQEAVAVAAEEDTILPTFDTTSTDSNDTFNSTALHGRTRLLAVEDNSDMRHYLERLLSSQYSVLSAKDGAEGLEKAKAERPDIILTDAAMPRMSGFELLKAIRADEHISSTPVIMLTARAGSDARIESYEAGADDYVTKPFDEGELLARISNILKLRRQERELALLREEKLKRFLPSQLANLISAGTAEEVLKSHRREITVVFLDLRGFTGFAEKAEPEDVMEVLHGYQAEVGKLIAHYGGTLERFAGDGIMTFFNDPIPVPNHAEIAVRMAVEIQKSVSNLKNFWDQQGFKLGLGIGIASGYATLGMIGFEGRRDYGAIGTVTNLAARLCSEAQHGQILISSTVEPSVRHLVEVQPFGELNLRGFARPIPVFNVSDSKK
jgi:signal transduction histidine kinase/class 3 adenylate cyclase